MTVSDITKFINSRAMVAVAGIVMLAAARIAFQHGDITYFGFNRGLLFSSANLWIANPWLTMAVNTALLLVTALTWMVIIEIFHPFRSLTTLPASFYLIMIVSVPDIMDQLYTGTLLAAVLPLCLTLLWMSYGDIGRLREIFLLFAILSGLSMTQYCFAVYIPVFILGCAQMKIFCLRTVIACLLGILTPWWIVFGLGLASPLDVHLPEMSGFFHGVDADTTINIVAVSALTVVLLVIAWFANVMHTFTLNANLRAFNGSISLIAVMTILAMGADFLNAMAYLPTLMLVTGYQLAFTSEKTTYTHRYIPVLAIMLVYIGFYATRLLL